MWLSPRGEHSAWKIVPTGDIHLMKVEKNSDQVLSKFWLCDWFLDYLIIPFQLQTLHSTEWNENMITNGE